MTFLAVLLPERYLLARHWSSADYEVWYSCGEIFQAITPGFGLLVSAGGFNDLMLMTTTCGLSKAD